MHLVGVCIIVIKLCYFSSVGKFKHLRETKLSTEPAQQRFTQDKFRLNHVLLGYNAVKSSLVTDVTNSNWHIVTSTKNVIFINNDDSASNHLSSIHSCVSSASSSHSCTCARPCLVCQTVSSGAIIVLMFQYWSDRAKHEINGIIREHLLTLRCMTQWGRWKQYLLFVNNNLKYLEIKY